MSAFGDDGFALLPGFFSGPEVATLRGEVAAVLDAPSGLACERPHNMLLPLRWNDRVVRLALDEPRRVQALRDALGAADLRWISGYVSTKEARSPALWWHQDWWCWDHPVSYRAAAPQVALLTYLTDTAAANGALRILPGSHRRSVPLHALLPEAHGDSTRALPSDHAAMSDLPGQLTPELRAGDAVVLDYRLLHGTHANASDLRRDGILLSFAPAWSELPADVRAHLILHPALPLPEEDPQPTAAAATLLPAYDGERASLPLNRNAPARFSVSRAPQPA